MGVCKPNSARDLKRFSFQELLCDWGSRGRGFESRRSDHFPLRFQRDTIGAFGSPTGNMGTKRAQIHCSEANSPEKRSTSFVLPLCTFRVEERFEGFRHLLVEDVSIAHRRFNRGAREQYRRRAGANRRLSDRGVPHFEPTAFHPPFLDPASCARSPILLEGALDCWHCAYDDRRAEEERLVCHGARISLTRFGFPF